MLPENATEVKYGTWPSSMEQWRMPRCKESRKTKRKRKRKRKRMRMRNRKRKRKRMRMRKREGKGRSKTSFESDGRREGTQLRRPQKIWAYCLPPPLPLAAAKEGSNPHGQVKNPLPPLRSSSDIAKPYQLYDRLLHCTDVSSPVTECWTN